MLAELAANIEVTTERSGRSSINRTLQLVGKALGMFVDRQIAIRSPPEGLSADQLSALLQVAERLQGVAQLAASARSTPPLIEAPREGQ